MPHDPRRRRSGLTVELSRVSLERGGKRILRGLDWTIRPGERWLLLGSNGAGKTQLLKLIAGDVWPTPDGRGSVHYRYRGELLATPFAVKDEIAYVGAERQDRYQHYEWNHRVTTLVGTGLHREEFPLARLSAADRRSVLDLLRRLGLSAFANRRFLTLSYGERRLVLVARALAMRPELLLLDELLNGLDAARRSQVLEWLDGRRLAAPGSKSSWVLSTHRREDIPRTATHVFILERGRASYAGRLGRTHLERWFRRTAGAPGCVPSVRGSRPSVRRIPAVAASPGARTAKPLVALQDAEVWLDGARILQGLSFSVRPGECWVVHGGNGAGKSTLLRTLYGDHSVASSGRIVRRGIEPGVPLEYFRRRVGLVAPHLQADHPLHLTVEEVVHTGRRASIGLNERATRADRAAGLRAMERFGIAPLRRARLREISYGQFRRALFARAWVNRPRLMLLDEPFEGLDPATRRDLIAAVDDLVAEGVAVVIATHHRNEWPAATSHELELARGRVQHAGAVRRRSRRPHTRDAAGGAAAGDVA